MKRTLLLLFLFVSLSSIAQMHVTVTPTGTHIFCNRDSVGYFAEITGTDTSQVAYRWQKNGIDIPGADSAFLLFPHARLSDTGEYRCIASKLAMIDTSNIVVLRMHPAMKFDTLYRFNALGCAQQCKGQFKAMVSGGTPNKTYPPYYYSWHGGHSQDTICFGLCPGKHKLTVTDSLGCSIDSMYFVDVLKSPRVRYTILPSDTIYLTNPTATLQFNDTATAYMTNWKYYMYYNVDSTITTSNVNPVSYSYDRTGLMATQLKFRDKNGCDTVLTDTLTVKLINLFIPNAMSSDEQNSKLSFREKNADGKPTSTDLDLREVYLSNELWIFDRWGRKIYHTTDYVNSSWSCSKLPDGTYYFIFKGHGPFGDDSHHGTITVIK